jgi:hypothetical protein
MPWGDTGPPAASRSHTALSSGTAARTRQPQTGAVSAGDAISVVGVAVVAVGVAAGVAGVAGVSAGDAISALDAGTVGSDVGVSAVTDRPLTAIRR